MSERKHDARAYRAQGERPDGTIVTANFLSLAKAEKAASKMMRSRILDTGQVFPPLTNVRVVRSAPLRWIYTEEE